MPRIEIKTTHRPNIQVPGFTAGQMHEFAEFSIEVMKERNAAGTNVFDQPAKPLSEKYAKRKLAKGKQPIRDLNLTGNLLGSIAVLESSESHAKVGIRGATPFRKALVNQNRDPWFGLSGRDDERLFEEKVRPTFSQNLADAIKP